MELALWMAGEYCSTPARALSLVLPPPGARADGAVGRAHRRRPRRRAADRQPAGGARAAARAGRRRPRRRCGGSRRAGWSAIAPRARRRAPRTNATADRAVELTPEQEAAVAARPGGRLAPAARRDRVRARPRSTCARAREALGRGRGVIVLVPEIALTPQTVARFQARFGDTVALLHSALGEGERYDEWRRLRTGEARIAVGPRSAVFAPVRRPRAGRDRRGARQLLQARGRPALRRPARRRRARPPVRRRAARRLGDAAAGELAGRCAHLTLPSRVDDRPLPPVEVLDMRGAQHPLHPLTRARAAGGAQVDRAAQPPRLVELPHVPRLRQGLECPQCDVALVLHRAEGAIACHHCGHRERVPERCDACGSLAVARYGAGTERIEAELRRRSTCRSSGSTPTPRRPRTPCPSCSRASTPRPPGCCSAPRWSPRATTSRT